MTPNEQAQLARFQAFARASTEGFVVHDGERFLDLSPQLADLVCRSCGELIGAHIDEVVAPESRAAVHQHVEAGENRTYETDVLRSDGQRVHVGISARTFVHRGQMLHVAAVRDLSDRVALETTRREALSRTIRALANTIEVRDPYTAGHQSGVERLSIAIAEKVGVGDEAIGHIALGARIHDIGKIGIPVDLLIKPTTLSRPEFELIKSHPSLGYDIVKEAGLPEEVVAIVRGHHERLDGSGYPDALTADAICVEARIVAVADVIEAASGARPYRVGRSLMDALQLVSDAKGTKFDADAAKAAEELIRRDGFSLLGQPPAEIAMDVLS